MATKAISINRAPVPTLWAAVDLLRTTDPALSADDVWRTYLMLTRVEAAFRNLKTDLKPFGSSSITRKSAATRTYCLRCRPTRWR